VASADRAAIVALLQDVESAHGNYETNTLGGVRDEAWAQWYAGYLLEHGLADQLSSPGLTPEHLASRLVELDEEYRRTQPNVPWTEFYAERLFADAA
jgi:hypothetical protein